MYVHTDNCLYMGCVDRQTKLGNTIIKKSKCLQIVTCEKKSGRGNQFGYALVWSNID